MLESFLKACSRHRGWAVGTALALATVVALLDHWSGDHVPLLICYLPSLLVVCWISHVAIGVSLAIACSCGWLIDDLLLLEAQPVTVAEGWTALTHLIFFLVINSMLIRLRAAQENDERFARTDSLTGLLNRKAFREQAQREVERARCNGRPLAVAYLDCDRFKEVNDAYGHLEGDRLLIAIGQSMKKSVRVTDTAARMGGDEFAILLPSATRAEAERIIQRVRSDLNRVMQQNEWPVTFSIGVMVYKTLPATVDELIHRSDLLMYEVKREQKNAVAYKLSV